jgi:hypothetical protein
MSLLGATVDLLQNERPKVSNRWRMEGLVKSGETRRHEIQMTMPWWRGERCDEPSGEKRQVKPLYAEGLPLKCRMEGA